MSVIEQETVQVAIYVELRGSLTAKTLRLRFRQDS
jgi:hypothetical protein